MVLEYDFPGGARGKYVERYRKGTNIVLLDPELAQALPDSKSVNDALRAILEIVRRTEARGGRWSGPKGSGNVALVGRKS